LYHSPRSLLAAISAGVDGLRRGTGEEQVCVSSLRPVADDGADGVVEAW
jgi:hypothetical protein